MQAIEHRVCHVLIRTHRLQEAETIGVSKSLEEEAAGKPTKVAGPDTKLEGQD